MKTKYSVGQCALGFFIQSETEQDDRRVVARESAFLPEEQARLYVRELANGDVTPLQVMKSNAGYYIGRACNEDGFPVPFSRESVEYFATRDDAEFALQTGIWTQRDNY